MFLFQHLKEQKTPPKLFWAGYPAKKKALPAPEEPRVGSPVIMVETTAPAEPRVNYTFIVHTPLLRSGRLGT
jgi:hypothetical protein